MKIVRAKKSHSRFSLLLTGICLMLFAQLSAAATIGDDGLHKQSWFSLTFKDVAEDISDAAEENKRLVIVFEQRGCIYCDKMHKDILADATISDYLQKNYNVVQFNLFGDEEVIDLDGEVLTEKTAAEKWGVLFTPTILFLPEAVPEQSETALSAAVAAMPGAFGKKTFLHMFQWVQEKGYESDEHFQKYHARRLAEDR